MPFTILPNFYPLPLPINKCLGHNDLLNISHVHHVYLQLQLSFKSFEKNHPSPPFPPPPLIPFSLADLSQATFQDLLQAPFSPHSHIFLGTLIPITVLVIPKLIFLARISHLTSTARYLSLDSPSQCLRLLKN